MENLITQNLQTAAILAAMSKTFENDYLSEESFLRDLKIGYVNKEVAAYLRAILRMGSTAKIALDVIKMDHLYKDIQSDLMRASKGPELYKELIKEAAPAVFRGSIIIGGVVIHPGYFLDKFFNYSPGIE